jgi:hypothetical protein
MADIFNSYTSNDRDWAFRIAKQLKALGDEPHVHEWEVNADADIYAWMEAHEDAARLRSGLQISAIPLKNQQPF